MDQESLVEMLEDRPFVPLRLSMSNGKEYEIRHREMVFVAPTFATIAISHEGHGPRIDRVVHCALAHINSVEPLAAG